MTLITENPWPLIILFSATGVVAFLLGSKGRNVAGLCALLAVGTFFLERALISTGEEIEAELEQMLVHFRNADTDAISSQIAPDNTELVDLAQRGINMVSVSESFHIQDVRAEATNDGVQATVTFRANGQVTLKSGGYSGHAATLWQTQWRLIDGQWKLSEVVRLDPRTGQEIGALAKQ